MIKDVDYYKETSQLLPAVCKDSFDSYEQKTFFLGSFRCTFMLGNRQFKDF